MKVLIRLACATVWVLQRQTALQTRPQMYM